MTLVDLSQVERASNDPGERRGYGTMIAGGYQTYRIRLSWHLGVPQRRFWSIEVRLDDGRWWSGPSFIQVQDVCQA